MYARKLQYQDNDFEETTLYFQHIRLEKIECYKKKYGIWHEKLVPGDIVLLNNTRREKNISHKLTFKWLGLYMISDMIKDKGMYMLEELDGLHLARIFVGDRFRKFHSRYQI